MHRARGCDGDVLDIEDAVRFLALHMQALVGDLFEMDFHKLLAVGATESAASQ